MTSATRGSQTGEESRSEGQESCKKVKIDFSMPSQAVLHVNVKENLVGNYQTLANSFRNNARKTVLTWLDRSQVRHGD